VRTPKFGSLTTPPRYYPWTRPDHAPGMVRGLQLIDLCREKCDYRSLLQLNLVGARLSRATPGRSGPFPALILFFTRLFPSALACQRCFHTLLFAGLQVKGVTFHFLDDVFLLHLALEAAEGILQ